MRLVFNNLLASGAFGVPAPTYYTITPVDALGVTPGVRAALVIVGLATNVELVLDQDLSNGAVYTIAAVGVPAQSGPASTIASTQRFSFGQTFQQLDVEPAATDVELLLYGADLIWNGADFQETTNGDLARIAGTANAVAAVLRREFAESLPWDASYGAKPRQFVDIPTPSIGDLRTALLAQALQDDRVKSVKVAFTADSASPDEVTFEVDVELIGGQTPDTIPITVQTK